MVWLGAVCPAIDALRICLRHFSFRDTLTEVRTPYICNAAVHAQYLAGGFGRPNGDKTTQNSTKMRYGLYARNHGGQVQYSYLRSTRARLKDK